MAPSREKKTLEDVRHGLLTMFNPSGPEPPIVDIVAVPGLGTNPLECWTHGKTKGTSESSREDTFNWIKDANGLHATFPNARILCYAYASAWYGDLKIESSFGNIVTELCNELKAKRESAHGQIRPIIFIGHSMGGLVIAQALNELDRQRDIYPDLLPCVTACFFFGVPFRGTDITQYGLSLSEAFTSFGVKSYPKLLTLMEPLHKNAYLQKLCGDFRQLADRYSPSIDLRCVYETDDIDFERLLGSFGILAKPATYFLQKKSRRQKFVTRESATYILSNPDAGIALHADHSNLVKFKDPTHDSYQIVLRELKGSVSEAQKLAKRRQAASRQTSMSPQDVEALRRLLESGVIFKHETILGKLDKYSWFLQEEVYNEWKSLSSGGLSCLWLTGKPGVGKTTIALSAIANIRRNNGEKTSKSEHTPLVAFFLCDTTPVGSSPVELLKALLLQLINQNPLVADYAKSLLTTGQGRLKSQARSSSVSTDDTNATMSLHNLWTCLNDILNDDAFGEVYIIINNVHLLVRGQQSDLLLNWFIDHLMATANALQPSDGGGVPHRGARRWLFTRVRGDDHDRFGQLITAGGSKVFDLSADEYKEKISNSLEEYVMTQVRKLRQEKNYPRDQAYMIQDLMKAKAADKHWIDIQYIRLKALEDGISMDSISEILSPATALDLRSLKRTCWLTIFEQDQTDRHALKNLLGALALAFRPPTIEELSVLSGIGDQARVRMLVERCKPMVQQVAPNDETQGFEFSNSSLKVDFLWESDEGLNSEDEKQPLVQRFHGMLAWRCFTSMEATQDLPSPTTTAREIETAESAGNSLAKVLPTTTTTAKRTAYPWEFWMQHAIRGKKQLAEDLVRELEGFWSSTSPLRETWLKSHPPKTPSTSSSISHEGMTALHAAAVFGYNELVWELMSKGHKQELIMFNGDGYTPLHIAAMYNHTQTIETLLAEGGGGVIDSGIERDSGTALHVAAIQGHVDTVKLLLEKGADPNAFCTKFGPVINAAIRSGNNEAVQLLLHHPRHSLESPGARSQPPLALAAAMSKKEVFEEILSGGKGKWTQDDYHKALDKACFLKKRDSVDVLLKEAREALDDDTLRKAMLTAATQDNWGCVAMISRAQPGLAGGEIFYLAAVTMRDVEAATAILREIWKTTAGSSIPMEVINAALYQAADNEKYHTVCWLLDSCGAQPNNALDKKQGILPIECFNHDPQQRYGNALTAAAWDGSKLIVETLIEHGAEVDSVNGSALQMAAQEGHVEVVKILLERGARIDRNLADDPSYRGPKFPDGTALQAACQFGRKEVVKTLLEWKGKSANPNRGGGPFQKPILAATKKDYPEVLELLLADKRIDVNVCGANDMSTPLINAAFFMSAEAAELLIKAGADVNQIDANGDTAIIRAASKGDARTLRLLIDNRANLLHEKPGQEFPLAVAAKNGHVECVEILANALAPLFSALNRVASRNSTMKTLLASPEGDHVFFDEEAVRPLQKHLKEANDIITETQRIRDGWESMKAEVKSAKKETASYQKDMDDMRRDWDVYREKTDRKQENYDVSITGFRAVEGERNRYLQELNTSRLELARLREECNAAKADAEKARNEAAQERHQELAMREGAKRVADAEKQKLEEEKDWLIQENAKLNDENNRLKQENKLEPPSNGSQDSKNSSFESQEHGKPTPSRPIWEVIARKSKIKRDGSRSQSTEPAPPLPLRHT
ncbi:hypothetical protein LZ30DRAFT_827679 [Colletotrichum cereale]|nr:hypothetical protein LZ30DRAFT_827679 [Colletotrichum cereale]